MTRRTFDRVPNTLDPRDWPVRQLLAAPPADPFAAIDSTLTAMANKKFVSKVTLAWAQAVTAYLHANKPTPPVPVPVVTGGIVWKTRWQLDQGETGHCVGFGWAQRLNAQEANDPDAETFGGFTDADAHAIYYEAKIIDGEPGAENGTSTRSGAKAMKARGMIKAYAFAKTTAEITVWVTTRGPVVAGTDWYEGMENPDKRGLVRISGEMLGGHEWLIIGYDPAAVGGPEYVCQNSWGDWGVSGQFRIKVADFAVLLAQAGDACVVVEAA